MDVLSRILLEVDALEANLSQAGHRDGSAGADGQLVLRDLIALRQVRIEVVLPCPDAAPGDGAAEGLARLDRHLDRAAVQRRQRPGQPEADRADLRVGRRAELRRAAAEDLRSGEELRVDFQANHGLEIGGRHVSGPPAPAEAASPRARRRGRCAAASLRRTACR